MEHYPLISVIIPTHSGSQIISRALDSVLGQTYPNVEVIVVDDNGKGSEEQMATQHVLQNYLSDKKVRYVVHEISKNGAAARNSGVKESQGEFIALLDDDDYFLPNNLMGHYKTFIEHDESYGVSFCGMHIVYGKLEEDIIAKQEGNVLVDFLMRKMRVGSSLIMIRKSVYEEFNGFDESFKRHQDWEFLTRIFTKYNLASTHKVGVVKIVLNRNYPANPEKFEKYEMYYLDKMKDIIDSLPASVSKSIYDRYYTSIAREYFRAGKLGETLKWCRKTSSQVTSIVDILRSAIVYVVKRIKV